jgi:hypothetical protein
MKAFTNSGNHGTSVVRHVEVEHDGDIETVWAGITGIAGRSGNHRPVTQINVQVNKK